MGGWGVSLGRGLAHSLHDAVAGDGVLARTLARRHRRRLVLRVLVLVRECHWSVAGHIRAHGVHGRPFVVEK